MAPELITERQSVTVDKSKPFAEAEWFLPASTTRTIAPGVYRLRSTWGDAESFLKLEFVDSLVSADDDRNSRRWAALDTANAARARGRWTEMQQAVEPMLTELPNDPALLRVKAEALEQSGDLEGAWVAIRRAVGATSPPPGVHTPEIPDPLSMEAQSRIGTALMRQRRTDAGTVSP